MKPFSRLSEGRRSDARRAADTNHAMRAFGQLSIAEAANGPLRLLNGGASLRRKIREAGGELVEFDFVGGFAFFFGWFDWQPVVKVRRRGAPHPGKVDVSGDQHGDEQEMCEANPHAAFVAHGSQSVQKSAF